MVSNKVNSPPAMYVSLDTHEEQLLKYQKNLDTMGRPDDAGSDAGQDKLAKIFQAPIDGKAK